MRGIGLVVGGCLLACGVAEADDCKPLKLLATVQMTRGTDEDYDLVPVKINGIDQKLIFQTGGTPTELSYKIVNELKLPINNGGIDYVKRQINPEIASVGEFVFAGMRAKNVMFPIRPFREYPNGFLGTEYLRPFDVDVDYSTDKLNLFSRDHCPGRVIYWQPTALSIVPITIRDNGVTIPVTIEGHEVTAYVTSTPNKTMRIDVAQRVFGLTLGSPDTPEAVGEFMTKDSKEKEYNHVFKTLSFGDVTISNAHLQLIPDLRPIGKRDSDEPGVFIGMGLLRKLHIYFAFGENKMYITPASNSSQSPTPAATAGKAVTPN